MNKKEINLRIITPDSGIKESNHSSIQVLGSHGVFQMLPFHEDYIDILRQGIVLVAHQEIFKPYCIISKSLLKFDNVANRCEISSAYAANISEIQNFHKDYVSDRVQHSDDQDEKDFYIVLQQYLSSI